MASPLTEQLKRENLILLVGSAPLRCHTKDTTNFWIRIELR